MATSLLCSRRLARHMPVTLVLDGVSTIRQGRAVQQLTPPPTGSAARRFFSSWGCAPPARDAVGSRAVATRRASTDAESERLQKLRSAHMARGLPKRQGIDGVKHVILVASGKGGVGKSTTAVNLAVALSRSTKALSVGLLDADVYGPSIPRMMSLSGNPELDKDDKMIPLINYGVKCMSMGFLVDDNAAIVWRGLMVMQGLERLVRHVAWSPLDVLVVDMPPGTGDAQLTISQMLPLSGVVLVTTPQDVALADVRRANTMFEKVKAPVLGVVQNMSVFVCPNCSHQTHIFGNDGAGRLAKAESLELLGDIPLHVDIRHTSDAGTPITVSQPTSPQALAYVNIADAIQKKLEQQESTPS